MQERLDARDKIEALACRVVRDHLPEEHRAFYAQAPFVLTGTVDDEERPLASFVPQRSGGR